jgi:hypothetical protein
MEKYLIKLWLKDFSVKDPDSSGIVRVTVKITSEKEMQEQEISIFNDGDCCINCEEFEIVGSQSDNNWVDYFKFEFDGTCLIISTVKDNQDSFRMRFPIPI